MPDIVTALEVKSLTDGNILLFIYVLIGGLFLCGLFIGLVALKRWYQRRKEELNLLIKTKDNLEKLEQILSSQTSVDIRNFFIVTVPPLFRSIFLDVLQGFEDFSLLRGYQSLLSFHSFSNYQIGFKYAIGKEGVGVSAGQAKADFADYIDRVHSLRNFETKAIFLDPSKVDMSRTLLMKQLLRIQKAFHAADEYQSTLYRLFTTITEKGFASVTMEKSIDPEPDFPIQTDGDGDEKDSPDNGVFLEYTFTKRNQQIEQLEFLITRLVQNPTSLHATVYFEEARNEMIEVDTPNRERVNQWLQEAAQSMEQSDLEAEDIEILKKVYASFHAQELLLKGLK